MQQRIGTAETSYTQRSSRRSVHFLNHIRFTADPFHLAVRTLTARPSIVTCESVSCARYTIAGDISPCGGNKRTRLVSMIRFNRVQDGERTVPLVPEMDVRNGSRRLSLVRGRSVMK